MGTGTSQTGSDLLKYLPAIYQEHPFLGQFLLAFEKVLLGRDDGVPLPDTPGETSAFPGKGLEEAISQLAVLFDPERTPEDFLPWLAAWTAFTLRADLTVTKQRHFVAQIIPLYRRRGTKENLQTLLSIFTVGVPTITEVAGVFQVGAHSTVGVDTYVGEAPPHYFRVVIALPRTEPKVIDRQMEIAKSLIEFEKPAHTFYDLERIFPSMQIGKYSTVGVDTLLGAASENQKGG
jgi:phage tail-like protein